VGPEFSGKSARNPYLHKFVADVRFDVVEEFSIVDAASKPPANTVTDPTPLDSVADKISLDNSSSSHTEDNQNSSSSPTREQSRQHYWTFTRPGVLDDDSPWLVSNINEALTPK
jgi:hypothetical protein